jgi:hypothetical protein
MRATVRCMLTTDGPDPLDDVLTRFPEWGGRIRELFQEDEQFRELCTDYGECLLTLRRLRRGGATRDEHIEQYIELRLGLEQELQGRIAEQTRG